MIHNHDRSGWIGASDTSYVMGSWSTASFARWWAVKLGLIHGGVVTRAMQAGTAYEHHILHTLGITRTDRTIYRPLLRLRVNLDGEDAHCITEVKTHKKEVYTVSRAHWQQCQVQQYAAHKPCRIAAYRLLDDDYDNYFNDIDPARLTLHTVEYDAAWIETQYLPRLRVLARSLWERSVPHEPDSRV